MFKISKISLGRLSALAMATSLSLQVWAQSGPISVDLPPQALDRSIQALARQSGAQILFVSDITVGKQAQALRGQLSVREALERLLTGSGLVVRTQNERTFTIERAPVAAASTVLQQGGTLNEVRVVASVDNDALPKPYAGGQVATGGQLGLLGNVSVMDTPFNVSRYTSELAENQQAQSLKDVLDNDPSVRASSPRGGENGSLILRGFEFTGREAMMNGMLGMADTRDSMIEAAERIEVHKGPSALLNGTSPWGSSPGGSVNYILKRASDDPLTRLTLSYLNDSQAGGHLDVGRRFGDKQQFGIRVNGVYRDGDINVDNASNREKLGVLSLDYRGEKLRLFGDLNYQDRTLLGGLSSTRIGSSVAIPAAPDGTINSKQPWEMYDGQNRFAMLRAEYDLASQWTVAAAYGKNSSSEVYLLVIDSISNVNGDKSGTPYWIPARSENESREISLKGKFDTGPISHQLSVIGSENKARRGQLNWSVPGCGTNCAPSNIYNPIYYPTPDLSTLNRDGLKMTSQYDYSSLAVADMMKMLDDRVIIIAGARQQKVSSDNYNYNTGVRTGGYSRQKLSPALGVVFKPVENLSLYASYIERLAPGQTVGTYYANAGDLFEPYVTDQYETGVKYDFGRFTATASVFQIELASSTEAPNPAGGTQPILKRDGMQRNRGFELNVYGEPVNGLRLLGGLMLLDAKMVQTDNGTNDGKRARGSPRTNLNLGTEWDVPMLKGLTLSARAVYTSRENLDYSGRHDRSIPSWTRYDLGARYSFNAGTTPVTLRLNVDNVFDRNYWSAASRGVLTIGAARTIRLSASFDF